MFHWKYNLKVQEPDFFSIDLHSNAWSRMQQLWNVSPSDFLWIIDIFSEKLLDLFIRIDNRIRHNLEFQAISYKKNDRYERSFEMPSFCVALTNWFMHFGEPFETIISLMHQAYVLYKHSLQLSVCLCSCITLKSTLINHLPCVYKAPIKCIIYQHQPSLHHSAAYRLSFAVTNRRWGCLCCSVGT